jgi:putative DNA primase/helicase
MAQSRDEEELRKCLGAALIAGNQIISLDNCENELTGAFLCTMLTQDVVNVRELGFSRNIATAPNNASLFANGNNLIVASDIVRRVPLGRLDAKMERPWEREFDRDILEIARDERGKLVCAILTVLHAWHLAGKKLAGVSATGSYQEWSYRVRQPLIWLGYKDPWSAVRDAAANDPRQDELLEVITEWKRAFGTDKMHTTQQVINQAVVDFGLFSALATVALMGKSISNVRLGRWLHRVNGKIAGGYKLTKSKNTGGYPYWTLVEVT